MTFHIITIFPEIFESYFNASILGRAIKGKKIKIKFYNPRDYSTDKHKSVDDIPYGGGPGMVMSAEPILKAFKKAKGRKTKVTTYIFSPGGKPFTNLTAQQLSKSNFDIILICGRYEGIDGRVKKTLKAQELSIGNYVVTGGELPAMVVVDAVARHIPDVLGKKDSIEENRVSSHEVYTRPESFTYQGKTYRVPKVLLSGDHKKIENWRKGK